MAKRAKQAQPATWEDNGQDVICLMCDGAGLVPCSDTLGYEASRYYWGVTTCTSCNGYGMVYVNKKTVHKYAPDSVTDERLKA